MLRTREQGSPLEALRPCRHDRPSAPDDPHRARGVRAPRWSTTRVAIAAATARRSRAASRREPRATLQLVRAAKAARRSTAATSCCPDDIDALAVPVLAHRLMAAKSSGLAYGRGRSPRSRRDRPVHSGAARRCRPRLTRDPRPRHPARRDRPDLAQTTPAGCASRARVGDASSWGPGAIVLVPGGPGELIVVGAFACCCRSAALLVGVSRRRSST